METNVRISEMDWNQVITDRGYTVYLETIRESLKKFLKQAVRLDRASDGSVGFSVGNVYLFGFAVLTDGTSEWDSIWCKWPDKEEARKRLIQIPETRWIDCLWNLNETINERLTLIRNFDPDYKPEEHQS